MTHSGDRDAVKTTGGAPCPKCKRPMQRYKHSPQWSPMPGRGFYKWWDRCEPCAHFQHYATAYVAARDKSSTPDAFPPTESALVDGCIGSLQTFLSHPGPAERRQIEEDLEAFQRAWMEARK
jgi:hypothetical protein